MNRTTVLGVAAAAVVSLVVDLVVGVSMPGLYSLVGIGGTVVIVVITKRVGKALLLRPEGSRVGDPRHSADDDIEPPPGPPANGDAGEGEDEEPLHTADPAGTAGLPRYLEDPPAAAEPGQRQEMGGDDRG